MACRIHHVVIEALEELAKGWKLGKTFIVLLHQIEYGVYGDLIIIYPKPSSIHLRGTIGTFRTR